MPRPSGVQKTWVVEYTEDYRLNGPIISNFLKSIFGNHDFHVEVISPTRDPGSRGADKSKHKSTTYSFWVPMRLTQVRQDVNPLGHAVSPLERVFVLLMYCGVAGPTE